MPEGKVGLGLITCNRLDYFVNCCQTIPFKTLDVFVVVNDGAFTQEFDEAWQKVRKLAESDCRLIHLVQHEKNTGVGIAKNDALQFLLQQECDHLFLVEDDMLFKRGDVLDRYVTAAEVTGIEHFNYGPGSPFNREQDPNIRIDLDTRHLLKNDSKPKPKLVVDYGIQKIALYEHTVAMFSYFSRRILEKVGLHDPQFFNAWEHVDLTYRIIKAGAHPPFWWFADLENSHELLSESPGAIANSSIANNTEQWQKNVYGGRELYKAKHGHYPNMPPISTEADVILVLKRLKHENITRS